MEKKNDFKPFISADKVLPEFTVTSVILGMILAVIFGGANAYLGLRVGMTVSASIGKGLSGKRGNRTWQPRNNVVYRDDDANSNLFARQSALSFRRKILFVCCIHKLPARPYAVVHTCFQHGVREDSL